MKTCTKCGSSKELSEFNIDRTRKDGHCCYCRTCSNNKSEKHNRKVRGHLPMSENKECTAYLGVHVAEGLIRHLFKDVVRMPNGNPGYDFICAKDKKIDVKSACVTMSHKKNPRWHFHIRKNKIADYFLFIAFDTRESLDPLHQWLIPGNVLNHLKSTATISPSTIEKWDEYRQDISHTLTCCNTMKNI